MPPPDVSDKPANEMDAGNYLNQVGDGVVVVSATGEVAWQSGRAATLAPSLRQKLVAFASTIAERGLPEDRKTALRRITSLDGSIEAVVSMAQDAGGQPVAIAAYADGTARDRLRSRIARVEEAGAALLDLDAVIVNPLNVAERLRLIEQRVDDVMRNVFHWDAYEVRLRDRRTERLEIVLSKNIEAQKVGEYIFAIESGNGVCGWVGATGRSALVEDVTVDPRYRPGLKGARSCLTVPLLIRERVVGVVNVESPAVGGFGDEDRLVLEIFGRYLAMALNILDMLLVERCMAHERLRQTIMDEAEVPLARLRSAAMAIAAGRLEGHEAMEQALEALEARLRNATSGAQTVLGIDRMPSSTDAPLRGFRILVADDESMVRESIKSILQRAGATVDVRDNGSGALDAVRSSATAQSPYDLVISDIRMPDRTGYDVFRGTVEAAPGTPVILMTGFGYDPHHSILRSSQEGLASVIFKPFQASDLLADVSKALSTTRPS